MLRAEHGAVSVHRGEIWMVDLDPTIGHEQAHTRPALVLRPHRAGALVETVTVVPITSKSRTGIASRVPIAPPEGGLVLPGDILTEHVRTISTKRFLRRMGIASSRTIERVTETIRVLLDL